MVENLHCGWGLPSTLFPLLSLATFLHIRYGKEQLFLLSMAILKLGTPSLQMIHPPAKLGYFRFAFSRLFFGFGFGVVEVVGETQGMVLYYNGNVVVAFLACRPAAAARCLYYLR